jgi:hypothetical protein
VLASGAGLLISGIAPYVAWSAFLCVICLIGTAVSLIVAGSTYENARQRGKLSGKETRELREKLATSLKSRRVLVLPPVQDPEPDDLSGYVPDGQCDLARELLRLMQAQVENAADRWDAVRDPLPNYRWHMSPEWRAEVLKLKQRSLGYPVDVGEEYGVPELVLCEADPEPAPQPPVKAVALLDEAVRSYRAKTRSFLNVLPEDQAEAAALLEQHDRAYGMVGNLVNKPLTGEAAVRYVGLKAELDAVRDRLKELCARYEAANIVPGLTAEQARVVTSFSVPPMATAPLTGTDRFEPHRCNGMYYQNVTYCPQHGR